MKGQCDIKEAHVNTKEAGEDEDEEEQNDSHSNSREKNTSRPTK